MTDAGTIITALIAGLTAASAAGTILPPLNYASENPDTKQITRFPALIVEHTRDIPAAGDNFEQELGTVNLCFYLQYQDNNQIAEQLRQLALAVQQHIALHHYGARGWSFKGWNREAQVMPTGESVMKLTINYEMAHMEAFA